MEIDSDFKLPEFNPYEGRTVADMNKQEFEGYIQYNQNKMKQTLDKAVKKANSTPIFSNKPAEFNLLNSDESK